mgnify:CR=1 FL=1
MRRLYFLRKLRRVVARQPAVTQICEDFDLKGIPALF